MTTITKQIIVLQYPKTGPGPLGHTIAEQAGRFVDVDRSSGGYPSPVDIDRAYDFKTIDKAQEYQKHFPNLTLCEVEVNYKIKPVG